MKSNKRMLNRKGFTMAEVLIVVAIIVVLAGVGFIALMSHMRNMQQLEMDGQAKEIFVAAQNHLAMADSQGYLGKKGSAFGTDDTVEANKDIHYFVVNAASLGNEASMDNPNNEASVLNLMLPFASVDESARISGSYIIRYQASSAQVLDVFYVSTSGRYKLAGGFTSSIYGSVMNLRGTEHKNDRKNYGTSKAVLGYYGGVDASLGRGKVLLAPGVEVINAEQLKVIVTDTNDATNTGGSANQVKLIVTGQNGGEFSVDAVVGGEFTFILDDVTGRDRHFADLASANVSKPFIPGEDITVKAIAYNNSVLTNVAESAEQTTNSLFASLDGNTAKIGNIRHLLNLDYGVSYNAQSINAAEQISDLIWANTTAGDSDFLEKTNGASTVIKLKAGGSTEAGTYYPVKPYHYETNDEGRTTVHYRVTSYDGKGHSISGIKIDSGTGALFTNAGLFADLDGCTVSNLELLDFSVFTKSGSAGALAGVVSDTTVRGVFVRNTAIDGGDKNLKIKTDAGAAGGLVGTVTGTSTIDMCASAVYVSASGNAGGLIGEIGGADDVTVSNSYSGGHTQNASYTDKIAFGPDDKAIINVISTGSAAGGLIGSSARTNGKLELSYCYSTASVQGSSVSAGLIGTLSASDTVQYAYSVGRAFGDNRYTFLGTGFTSSNITGPNYYLDGVTEDPTAVSITHLSGITMGDSSDSAKKFLIPESNQKQANTYDPALARVYSGKYMFPTIEQLHTVVQNASSYTFTGTDIDEILAQKYLQAHCGDWQVPNLTPLNYTFINGATLYTEIELENNTSIVSLALQGETSKNVRVYIISVDKTNGTAAVTKEYYAGDGVTQTELTTRASLVADYTAASGSDKAKLHIDLDDITTTDKHFVHLFADGDNAKLLPGENVTLYVAGGTGSWAELRLIEREEDQSGTVPDSNPYAKWQNSLFAKGDNKTTMSTAGIKLVRHLQNLDSAVSDVDDDVTAAALQDDITWSANWNTVNSDDTDTIYTQSGESATAGKFNGIYNTNLLSFVGNDYTIENLAIEGTVGISGDPGNAGLFRSVSSNLTISDLTLTNPTITSTSDAAGAVVAEITGGIVNMTRVLVDNPTITGSGNVGGIVGATSGTLNLNTVLAKGTAEYSVTSNGGADEEDTNKYLYAAGGLVGVSSTGSLTITNSAAALLVSANGPAGGLLGKQTSGTVSISESYVGGHTYGGMYYVGSDADSDPNGRWNIVSKHAASGGLIGETIEGTTAIEKSFNTASVYGANGKAGGLIGVANASLAQTTREVPRVDEDGKPVIVDGEQVVDEVSAYLYLVYTVAPVNDVKRWVYNNPTLTTPLTITNTVKEGSNGGAFGELASGSNYGTPLVFYLADIYEDSKFEYDENGLKTKSNISFLGAASNNINVQYAYSYELLNQDVASNYIVGISSEGNLMKETDVYDPSLKDTSGNAREFPFSIWTTFDFNGTSGLHFYGDWQPIESEDSIEVFFHFMLEKPEDAMSASDAVPVESFDDSIASTWLAVQMEPFTGAKLSIPTIPYLPGYDYGTEDSEAGRKVKWSIYYGDRTEDLTDTDSYADTALSGLLAGTCDKESGSFDLNKSMLDELIRLYTENVEDEVDNGVEDLSLTFVAHYYETDDQLTLRLMDYNPKEKVDNKPVVNYSSFGAIQVMIQEGDEAVYVGDEFEANHITIPVRSRNQYRFLGWFTGPAEILEDGTIKYNGTQVFYVNDDGEIDVNETNDINVADEGHLTLYAHYAPVEETSVTVNFKLVPEDATDISNATDLEAEYVLSFDANKGLDQEITVPWQDVTGFGVYCGTTPVTEYDASSPASEYYSFSTSGSKLSVHLHSDVQETYPDSYTVYIKGLQGENGYAIVYLLKHTEKDGSDYIFNSSDDAIIQYGSVVYKSTFGTPEFKSSDELAGFSTGWKIDSTPTSVASGTTQFNTLKEKYSISSSISDADGAPAVNFIFVVTYERKQFWLNFANTGDSYYASEYVYYGRDVYDILDGEKMRKGQENEPEYTGYDFTGWVYLDADEHDVPISGRKVKAMPAEDLDIFARWEGQPVGYTLMVWKENADGNGYSLGGYSKNYTAYVDHRIMVNATDTSIILTEKGGTGNTVKTEPAYDVSGIDEMEYYHLHQCSTSACRTVQSNNVVVEGDGSTVINVYYDRNWYTLWFFLGKSYTDEDSFSPVSDLSQLAEDDELYYESDGDYLELSRYDDGVNPAFYGYPATNEDNNVFGLVEDGVHANGVYERLSKAGSTYKKNVRYDPVADDDETVDPPQYGLIDAGDGTGEKEYVPLTYDTDYVPVAGTSYTETESEADGEYFGVIDGGVGGTIVSVEKVEGYRITGKGYVQETGAEQWGYVNGGFAPVKQYYALEGPFYTLDDNGMVGIVDGSFKNLTTGYKLTGHYYWEQAGTNDMAGEQYYIAANDDFRKLNPRYNRDGNYRYQVAADGAYGVANGQIVELTQGWVKTGTRYTSSVQNNATWGTYNYGMVELTHQGNWYLPDGNSNAYRYRGTRYIMSSFEPDDTLVPTSSHYYIDSKQNGFSQTQNNFSKRYAHSTTTGWYNTTIDIYDELEQVWTYVDPVDGQTKRYPSNGIRYTRAQAGTYNTWPSDFTITTNNPIYYAVTGGFSTDPGDDYPSTGKRFALSGDYYYQLSDNPSSWRYGSNNNRWTGFRYRRYDYNSAEDVIYPGTSYYQADGQRQYNNGYRFNTYQNPSTRPRYGQIVTNGKTYYYQLAETIVYYDSANPPVAHLYGGQRYSSTDYTNSTDAVYTDEEIYYRGKDAFSTSNADSTDRFGLVGGNFYPLSAAASWRYGESHERYDGLLFVEYQETVDEPYDDDEPRFIVDAARGFVRTNETDADAHDLYGLKDGRYYKIESALVWKDVYGDLYTGKRLKAADEDGSGTVYSGTTYYVKYAAGTNGFAAGEPAGKQLYGVIEDPSGNKYFPVKAQSGWTYSVENTSVSYDKNLPRYRETEIAETEVAEADVKSIGSRLYCLDDRNGRLPVKENSGDGCYTYNGEEYTGTPVYKHDGPYYTGTKYFYVSSSRGDYDYTSEHTGNFAAVGTSNPFTGTYTHTDKTTYEKGYVSVTNLPDDWYYVDEGGEKVRKYLHWSSRNNQWRTTTTTNGHYTYYEAAYIYRDYELTYTNYYYAITARYGQNIDTRWPDLGWMKNDARDLGVLNSNYFVSWITQPGSGYRNRTDLPSSDPNHLSNANIKGIYSMMTEELIKVNGVAQRDYDHSGSTPAHIMQGRYDKSVYHYLYVLHFGTGDGETYPDDAEHKISLAVDSAGYYPQQAELAYVGYTLDHRYPDATLSGRPETYEGRPYYLRPNEDGQYPIDYYYQPKPYKLYVLDRDGTTSLVTSGLQDGEGNYYIQCYYNESILSKLTQFETALRQRADWTFNGWYDNALFTGSALTSADKMGGDIVIYAKLTHDPVSVSFDVNRPAYDAEKESMTGGAITGSSTLTVEYEKPIMIPVTSGDTTTYINFLTEEGELRDGYKPSDIQVKDLSGKLLYTYEFEYWYDAGKDESSPFKLSQPLVETKTLKAKWKKVDPPVPQSITIRFVTVDWTNNENVIGTAHANMTAAYRDDDGKIPYTVSDSGVISFPTTGTNPISIGDYVYMEAPELEGYTRVDFSKSIYNVTADEGETTGNHEIVFRYHQSSWSCTVNYYVLFRNVPAADWLTSSVLAEADYNVTLAGNSESTPLKITDLPEEMTTINATTQYHLFHYVQPEGNDYAWLSNYRFDHYGYGENSSGEENEDWNYYITLHPDAGEELNVYLVADESAIEPEDRVVTYDGDTQAAPSADFALSLPSSLSGKVDASIYYLYYNANSTNIRLVDKSKVVNAGTYGVRAFITATVTGDDGNEKTYLIWQSQGSGTKPPLLLYIQRRLVYMVSTSDSKREDGEPLKHDSQTDVVSSGVPTGWTVPHGFVQRLVSIEQDGTKNFVQEGATYNFSASAFRLNVGTSLNVFDYECTENTIESNYVFWLQYGKLTVTNN